MTDVREELRESIDRHKNRYGYIQLDEALITDIIRLFSRHLWTMKNRRLLVADYDLEKTVLDSRR